jgi:septal ring factor EnvC (AmiA/AmiB activator)
MRERTQRGLETSNQVSALHEMLNRIVAMQHNLGEFESKAAADDKQAQYAAALKQAKALDKKLTTLKDSVYNSEVQHDAAEDDIHYLQSLNDSLQYMMYAYMGDPQQFPPAVAETGDELSARLASALSGFNAILQTDVPAYNKTAYAAGAPTLMVGEPISVKPVTM